MLLSVPLSEAVCTPFASSIISNYFEEVKRFMYIFRLAVVCDDLLPTNIPSISVVCILTQNGEFLQSLIPPPTP